jgi:hypothetical protein
LIIVERSFRGFFDRIRSRHERLTAFELVDGRTSIAQLHYAIAKFYDIGKADVVES